MNTLQVKAIKEIERKGLPPIKIGRVFETTRDYADKWIAAGLAEEVKPNRKPIDIPKVIAKESK